MRALLAVVTTCQFVLPAQAKYGGGSGTADFWWILEGQGYPRLWWEPVPEE